MENLAGHPCPPPCRTSFSASSVATDPTPASRPATPMAAFARLRPVRAAPHAPSGPLDRRQVLVLGSAYLLCLGLIELLDAWMGPAVPFLAPFFFGAALLLLLGHAGLCWGQPMRWLPLILAAAPALRLALLLRPAGPTPLMVVLALGLPALLAAAVTLRRGQRRAIPYRAVTWVGDAWQQATDLLRLRLAAFRQRLAPYGLPLVVLPALALLLAVAAGFLVVGRGNLPVMAAGLPASREAPGVWPGSAGQTVQDPAPQRASAQAVAARSPGRVRILAAGTRDPQEAAELRDNLARALALPLRKLMNAARAEPEHLALRAGARKALRVESAVADPGPLGVRLEWEDEAALIPLRDEAGPAAAARPDADDALQPRFAPPLPPPPVDRAATYPHCPSSGYDNPYPRGVCTWYAKERRPDLTGFWGDYGLAINWPYAAAACGYRVDGLPAAGAVIVFPPGANGAYEGGHVGYVEAVEEDALVISECNVTHDSAGIVEPRWWEAGYSCAFRRIPWSRLSPRVQYIHRW